MNWYGISGSWRHTTQLLKEEVEDAIENIIKDGHGIVSGGALGVDYIATNHALSLGIDGSKLKIIIPTPLSIYANHYFNRASEGVITQEQASNLIEQLKRVKSLDKNALIEMRFGVCNPETYYARNAEVIKASTHLLAFQVNDSEGVKDAINKAREQGKPVEIRKYNIP